MSPYHLPVMLAEVLEHLRPRPGQVVVDATLGGAGMSRAILERLGGSGRLIGIDQDEEAIGEARRALAGYPGFTGLHGNFADLDELLDEAGVDRVEGVLMDLGVSSHQLDEGTRGFSFRSDAPLDMRMDPAGGGPTAAELLEELPEGALERILREFGEERFARRLARRLVDRRRTAPLATTGELVRLVEETLPRGGRPQRIHPATRTFQALRIAVNRELERLPKGLEAAVGRLRPGGRIVVLSYHSLEDRIVKQAFRRYAGQCVCPPGLPVCRCSPKRVLHVITRRPATPAPEEVAANPRARSARLRAAERLP